MNAVATSESASPQLREFKRGATIVVALGVGILFDIVRTHPFFEQNVSRLAWLYAVPSLLIAVWAFASMNRKRSVLAWFASTTLALTSAAVVFYAYRARLEAAASQAGELADLSFEYRNPEVFNFIVLIPVVAILAWMVPIVARDNITTTRFLGNGVRRFFGTLMRIPEALGAASGLPRWGSAQTWRSSTAGLVLAFPVCAMLFGLLHSDRQFRGATQYIADQIGAGVAHVICALLVAMLAAFFMLLFRSPDEALPANETTSDQPETAEIERHFQAAATFNTDTLFTAFFVPVAGLFAIYATANFPAFFLGHAAIHSATGPSYAQHLHRGFEESVAASMLACALIWAETALRGTRRVSGSVKWMQCTLLALAWISVLSCGHRLYLYVSAYGLTPKRVFVGFFVLSALGSFALTARKVLDRATPKLSGELFVFYTLIALYMGAFPYFMVRG